VQSFDVRSSTVPRIEGGYAPIILTPPLPDAWHAQGPHLEAGQSLDLLGLVPLRVRGSITIQLVAGR
jgi:hypothetical protein